MTVPPPGRNLVVAAFVALTIALAACGGDRSAAPSTAPATEAGSGRSQTFNSAVYGYSLVYPVGWRAIAAERQLAPNEMPESGTASDRFTRHPATDTAPLIEVAAQPVAAGTTLKDWTDSVIKISYPHLDCKPDSQESVAVGGETATLLSYVNCTGTYVLWMAAVHRNAGFHLTLFTDPGLGPADRAEYLSVLRTLAFID